MSKAAERKVQQWHFDQQLSSIWKGTFSSKFDFSAEARYSVSLIRIVGSLLGLALLAAAATVALSSPAYAVTFLSITMQILMMVFVPSAEPPRFPTPGAPLGFQTERFVVVCFAYCET